MWGKIHSFFKRHYHRRYHGIYRHAKQLFVFDLALLGLALLMLGASIFFFFWKPGIADQVDVSLSLGETRIKSGEAVTLSIAYTNKSKFRLDQVTLGVRLPEGFIIDRTKTPTTSFSEQSTMALPSLSPGAKGRLEIAGTLWSDLGSETKIIAHLSFVSEQTPDTREQSLATYLVNLPESVLKGELSAPATTIVGQKLPITYTLTNQSDRTLSPITLNYDHNLIQLEDAPARLAINAHETKQFTGQITVPNRSKVALEITPSITINGVALKQGAARRELNIYQPAFTSKVTWKMPKPYLAPGGELPITVSWKNVGDVALKDLTLRLKTTPGTIDLAATARENRLRVDNGSLLIDSKARTKLSDGQPSSTDTFDLTLKLLPHFDLSDAEEPIFSIAPVIEGTIPAVADQRFTGAGEGFRVPVATEVSLMSEVRYFTEEGDQLGRGPLPPVVGETTKYWIFVRANNTSNLLRDANFNVTLAPGVQFTNKQSVTIGPQLAYNTAANAVSWHYFEIPSFSETGWYFEVAVSPTPDLIGKTIPLIKTISFSATDDVTNQPISQTSGALSNVLLTNDRGSQRGATVVSQ